MDERLSPLPSCDPVADNGGRRLGDAKGRGGTRRGVVGGEGAR